MHFKWNFIQKNARLYSSFWRFFNLWWNVCSWNGSNSSWTWRNIRWRYDISRAYFYRIYGKRISKKRYSSCNTSRRARLPYQCYKIFRTSSSNWIPSRSISSCIIYCQWSSWNGKRNNIWAKRWKWSWTIG